MASFAFETDVLIVGAGPVGLFAANECARRGMKWRLVEERAHQSEHSKALAIFPRTLEIFDMAGVVAPFVSRANRVTKLLVSTHQRTLGRMEFKPEGSPYGYVAMVPQDVTEALLVETLRARGGWLSYETRFVDAEEDADGVTVRLERTAGGRIETIKSRAKYVVGCDGAHSAVRHQLGLEFEGAAYKDTYLLADIETNEALPADEMQLCPSEMGPLAVFPMSATRRRIVATTKEPAGDAPSLEMVRQILKERAPMELEAKSLHWSSYFKIHHRQTKEMHKGRMFIAGDAAHIHSPFGGQGMNTGLQDAWNLMWKLDMTLRGHGNERLLESYSAERRPVIKSVVELTDRMTRGMGTANWLAQAVRDTVIPVATRLAPVEHAVVARLSELGVSYEGSPIVEGPGERCFEDWMRGGNGLMGRYVLLAPGAVVGHGPLAGLVEELGEVLEIRAREEDKKSEAMTLVRPDGYVAWEAKRGAAVDVIEVATAQVKELLRKQTAVNEM
ncbi:MAG: FAD-dependent monooxygenase [Acidobacteriota bacterium]|nr:FAD-dependent monooxygenase [Acidobacteriota bacterium]